MLYETAGANVKQQAGVKLITSALPAAKEILTLPRGLLERVSDSVSLVSLVLLY